MTCEINAVVFVVFLVGFLLFMVFCFGGLVVFGCDCGWCMVGRSRGLPHCGASYVSQRDCIGHFEGDTSGEGTDLFSNNLSPWGVQWMFAEINRK